LSDPVVLSEIDVKKRNSLTKNRKDDVIFYMSTWANLLRKNWLIENDKLKVQKLATVLL
jgi:hypothetical protein